MLHEVTGKKNGERNLGNLTRLEGQASDINPDSRAVNFYAETGNHGEEKQNHGSET
ncbi:unannotated protein [freshwater metagenome]|uniref:Unannotated protein n=1 Tax=freshwater metagenome TaxID=449393 RepID=A0A6J7F5U0_9ZZZZ